MCSTIDRPNVTRRDQSTAHAAQFASGHTTAPMGRARTLLFYTINNNTALRLSVFNVNDNCSFVTALTREIEPASETRIYVLEYRILQRACT